MKYNTYCTNACRFFIYVCIILLFVTLISIRLFNYYRYYCYRYSTCKQYFPRVTHCRCHRSDYLNYIPVEQCPMRMHLPRGFVTTIMMVIIIIVLVHMRNFSILIRRARKKNRKQQQYFLCNRPNESTQSYRRRVHCCCTCIKFRLRTPSVLFSARNQSRLLKVGKFLKLI